MCRKLRIMKVFYTMKSLHTKLFVQWKVEDLPIPRMINDDDDDDAEKQDEPPSDDLMPNVEGVDLG